MMNCRSCGCSIEVPFIDFGKLPLPNTFISINSTDLVPRYPLAVYFCDECKLVQLKNLIPPEEIFNDSYKYFSSYSSDLLEQSQLLCENTIQNFSLNKEARIVEIASNDGYLLNFFKIAGYNNILGIEPTLSTATKAIEKGIPTEICFFNEQTAERVAKIEKADIIIANNVIAHVPDINGFAKGLLTLIKDTGVVIIEFQYVLDLIHNRLFDLIYHEHFSYFSLQSIKALLNRNGLEIFRVEKTKSQGGSLRVFCSKNMRSQVPNESVNDCLDEEYHYGLQKKDSYEHFSIDVNNIRTYCIQNLTELKDQGKRLAAYGASAKGSVFLNFLGLDSSVIDYIVDKNENKQNMLLAGTDIPVFSPKMMEEAKVDYVLILSWNLKEEISTEYPNVQFFILQPDANKGKKFTFL